jgi:hypothetical protein
MRTGAPGLAFCCCQPLASITFCLQRRRFFVARPGLERDYASKLPGSGECRFRFVEQPKAPRISRRRLLE